MQTRRFLTLGVFLGLAFSMAGAETGKKGIEVIDLEPPPRTTTLPLEQDGSNDAATPAAQTEKSASAAEKFSAIEAKKNERLERIRSFFSKMKGESRDVDGRRPERFTPPEFDRPPLRPARGARPAVPVDVVAPEPAAPTEPKATASRAGLRSTAEGSYYKVQRGDTLARIAKKFFGTSQKFYLIADANGLSPTDRIRVGQELIIPEDPENRAASRAARTKSAPPAFHAKEPAGAKPVRSAASDPKKPAEGASVAAPRSGAAPEGKLDYASYDFKLYQVQAGDTFASVADKFYGGKGDPSLIKLYNNKKDALKPGEKILIPLPKADRPGKGG